MQKIGPDLDPNYSCSKTLKNKIKQKHEELPYKHLKYSFQGHLPIIMYYIIQQYIPFKGDNR